MKIKDISLSNEQLCELLSAKSADISHMNELDKKIFLCIKMNIAQYSVFYIVILNDDFGYFRSITDMVLCPEPDFNQVVYRFDSYPINFHNIWSIPSVSGCKNILNELDFSVVRDNVSNSVCRFVNGELLCMVSQLNYSLKEYYISNLNKIVENAQPRDAENIDPELIRQILNGIKDSL